MRDGNETLESGWTWWSGRRWRRFCLAVALGVVVGIVVWELATPRWAGDHIGLSLGAWVFYGTNAFMWIAALSVVYGLTGLSEYFVKPTGVQVFRRRAYAVLVSVGAASCPAWLASVVIAGWLRRH